MNRSYRPSLAHCGIFCRDVERMKAFYCGVFGMRETDRGTGSAFPVTLVFLSGRADQHHQLVLASSRPEGAASTVMQLSFKVDAIGDLREARRRALALGATRMRALNHGNALSIYCCDPEDNTVEVYLDTPWYVRQPHGDPLDLDQDDAAIWAQAERAARADPTFMPAAGWSARFAGLGGVPDARERDMGGMADATAGRKA